MNLKRVHRSFFPIIAMIALVIAVTVISLQSVGTMDRTKYSDKNQEMNSTVELFLLAPCENCNEDDKFRQEIYGQLTRAGYENISLAVHNVYKESGASHFSETVEKYHLDITMMDLPAAVVDGSVYQGTYQEIGKALVKNLQEGASADGKKSATGAGADTDSGVGSGDSFGKGNGKLTDSEFYRNVTEAGENDTVLVLFVTGACESCHDAQNYLEKKATDSTKLFVYSIMEGENLNVFQGLARLYRVPESKQQVPFLFTKVGYLSGADAIISGTADILEDKEAVGSWEAVIRDLPKEKETASVSKLQLVATGFINGLNPCGISMLLMVLSVLLMSKRSFLGGSFTFLAGKFLTYLFLGFMLGTFLGVIESAAFLSVRKGLEMAFGVLAFLFGVFYLIDFINVIKKDYGKVKMQLPERFRRWNHEMIGRLTKIPGHLWYPTLFLLGIVISAGEFLCTGQVYLASLIFMAEQGNGLGAELAGNLVVYLFAMCVPMLLFVILVSRGKTVMSASHLSVKILPFVKLAYSVFFFMLFIALFLSFMN